MGTMESPGMAFFGQGTVDEYPITAEDIDELCSGFLEIPTDGSGLKPELLKLGKMFTKKYEQPAIFCSPSLVMPNYYPGHLGPEDKWTDWGKLVQPYTFRALMMNLGEQDAKDVIVRLRNRKKEGDEWVKAEVWAKGIVDVPARSLAVAVLPVMPGKTWTSWAGKWFLEVEAPGCAVFTFLNACYWE